MIEMKRKRIRVALSAALMLLATPASAQPVSDADLARADELYRQGNVAFDAGKFEDALKLYRDAFAIKKSYDIAGNLGATELKLGSQREAAEHLSFSLRLFPANGKEKARKVTMNALAEAKTKVGCFAITVNVAGAKVQLGDRVVGISPVVDVACAYPAPSKLRVERDGYEIFEQEITPEVGKDVPISVTLKAGASGGGGGGGGGSDEPVEKPIWPAIVLGGAGAAGLAVGIAGVVVGAQKDADASALASSASCTPVVTPSCLADGIDLADEWATFTTVGIVGFGIGGAALVGMTIYLLVPTRRPDEAAWQVVPWLDPQTAGVSVGRTF